MDRARSQSDATKGKSGVQIERVIDAAFRKMPQIIVQARVLLDLSRAVRPESWMMFSVEQPDAEVVTEKLLSKRQDHRSPMVLEIFTLPDEATNRAPQLLERWSMIFRAAPGAAEDTSVVYQRLIILMRALLTQSRILPAYRLYRQLLKTPISQRKTTVGFSIRAEPSALNFEGPAPQRYIFTPTETRLGNVELAVVYCSDLSNIPVVDDTKLAREEALISSGLLEEAFFATDEHHATSPGSNGRSAAIPIARRNTASNSNPISSPPSSLERHQSANGRANANNYSKAIPIPQGGHSRQRSGAESVGSPVTGEMATSLPSSVPYHLTNLGSPPAFSTATGRGDGRGQGAVTVTYGTTPPASILSQARSPPTTVSSATSGVLPGRPPFALSPPFSMGGGASSGGGSNSGSGSGAATTFGTRQVEVPATGAPAPVSTSVPGTFSFTRNPFKERLRSDSSQLSTPPVDPQWRSEGEAPAFAVFGTSADQENSVFSFMRQLDQAAPLSVFATPSTAVGESAGVRSMTEVSDNLNAFLAMRDSFGRDFDEPPRSNT